MKVIVASFVKCGTKTLHKCLETLGYSVCDYDSDFLEHRLEWEEIFAHGSTTEQFKRMYGNTDAVCDFPSLYYWEEILHAFPESKIILTMRENQEEWLKSWEKQVKAHNSSISWLMCSILTPTGRRFCKHMRMIGRIVFSCPPQSLQQVMTQPNNYLTKRRYREHNEQVLWKAPKDKLLVFNFSDGWKPLCDFLGKEVPDIPFPHENRSTNTPKSIMIKPVFVKMKRELYFVLCCIFVVLALLIFHYPTSV